MSDNLSLEEIMAMAQEIKERAEKQLASAEQSLDNQAKAQEEDIVVDENEVTKKVIEVFDSITEEEEIKEFIPSKAHNGPIRIKKEKNGEEIKIAPDFSNTEKTATFDLNSKTSEDESSSDASVSKTKEFKTSSDNGKTKEFKSAALDEPQKTKEFKNGALADNGKTKQFDKDLLVDNQRTKEFSDEANTDTKKTKEVKESKTKIHNKPRKNNSTDEEPEKKSAADSDGLQIVFDGFDEKIDEVPLIDEDDAEQIVKENRREKVGSFRIFGPEKTDKKLDNSDEIEAEYINKSETEVFLANLLASRKSQIVKTVVTAIITLILLLITVSKDSAYQPAFLADHKAYFATALVLYIAALATNLNTILLGFRIKKRLNFEFYINVVNIAILIHTAILLFNNSLWIDNGMLFAAFGSFSLLMTSLGKNKTLRRTIDNFKFITSSDETYTIESITNNIDAENISRGLVEGEPMIKTSVKTDFPTHFLEISCKNEPANKLANTLLPIALLLNLILFLAVGFIDNFNTAFNILICGLSVSLPCCSLFLSNTTLCDVSSALKNFGSRVCGYEGAAMAYNSNIIVMEAADLFPNHNCEIHYTETFDGTTVDNAKLLAAAVMLKTKSPISRVFEDTISKQTILPKVENIRYEDKQGTSAWIYNKKILIGNRTMLKNHGVPVPSESYEKRNTMRGRKVLYLSVDSKLTAMFVVSYSADPDLKRELKKLEKSGITIIVKSTDPNVNEKSIAKLFALPNGYIRVMNPSAVSAYEKYSNMHVKKSPAYVVHNGTALGFVSAMRAAEVIVSQRRLIKFLSFFGSALGFGAVTLLALLGAYTQLSALSVILFQLIWNLFILLISKLRGINL